MGNTVRKPAPRTTRERPFTPGVSGNPGGRPPGLARLAREATGNGVDIIAFFTLVSRGVKPEGWPDGERLSADHMIDANRWLADRGWGRSPITIVTEEATTNPLDAIPYEQLAALREAMRTVLEAPKVIDAIDVSPTPDGS